MKHYNIAIVGFGNVGRALLQLLQEKTSELREHYGIEWQLTGVATRRMGWLADPDGLDVTALLEGKVPATNSSQDIPNASKRALPSAPTNVSEWLTASRADVLFELTSLNTETGQPAIEHVRAALEHGAHVITANKGTVVHGYRELEQLAREHGKQYLFEATVMGGAPIFSLFKYSLPAANIQRFRGILNSTSNVILEEMEQGCSFEDAIKKAQELGIAETDPSIDVDGWDATVKVYAIATVLMNVPLKLDEIERQGIRDLSSAEVQAARAAGTPYKPVASIERSGDGVRASVKPERLAAKDPLAAVSGGSMLAHFELDVLPGLTITLDVPNTGMVGPAVTAYDVLADFIRSVSGSFA
ncbi:MAG: homoserine dehydrogenase [Ktedonobacteraceae bacterium]|nr:homoserine dehydrogenase [Ktedonobacteraceae bacterium]